MATKKTPILPDKKPIWKEPWFGNLAQWAAMCCVLGIFLYGKYSDHAKEDFNLRVDARVEDKLKANNGNLTSLGERMSTVEGEIKVLLAEKYVADSARYIKRGDLSSAAKSADKANAALREATVYRVPVPPEFFEKQFDIINGARPTSPEVSSKLYEIRFALATYRSGLNTPPKLPSTQMEWDDSLFDKFNGLRVIMHVASTILVPPNKILCGQESPENRTALDAGGLKSGQDVIAPANGSRDENHIVMKNVILVNGTQTLDGINWVDATFFNMHIRYGGGVTALRNVKFVKCTFDLPETRDGSRLAEYAATEQLELRIG